MAKISSNRVFQLKIGKIKQSYEWGYSYYVMHFPTCEVCEVEKSEKPVFPTSSHLTLFLRKKEGNPQVFELKTLGTPSSDFYIQFFIFVVIYFSTHP